MLLPQHLSDFAAEPDDFELGMDMNFLLSQLLPRSLIEVCCDSPSANNRSSDSAGESRKSHSKSEGRRFEAFDEGVTFPGRIDPEVPK
jgi:hypothetical protein